MAERDRPEEPMPWDAADVPESEPAWAQEIRARRQVRAERLREVFEGFDGSLTKEPRDPR
jgi:hypothetical protein